MTPARHALISLSLCGALALTACEKTPPAADPTPPAAPAEATEPAPVAEVAEPAAPAAPADANILGVGSTPEDIAAGASHVYGNNFTIIEEPLTLAAAIDKAGTEGEGPYKVSANVEKVCQAKGCWFTLKAADVPMPIRVKMKDYKFFVPRNSADMPVVLEGTFKQVTVPQDEAQHYADDEAANTGKPARKIDGPQQSWEFLASAVQITNDKT